MPLTPPSVSTPLVTVTTMDLVHSIGTDLVAVASAIGGSAVWPAAGRILYIPIYLDEVGSIVKFFFCNGTVAAGTIDIGLYSEAGSKLVSSGATTQAGVSTLQTFDTTDYTAGPGRYYLGICLSSGSATVVRSSPSLSLQRTMGVLQEAGTATLPASKTGVAPASAFMPLAGFSYRVTI